MAGVEGGMDPRLIAAHRALHAKGDVQFRLTRDPGPPPTPEWVKTLGEWIQAFGEWLGDVLAPVGRALRWISDLMPDAPYARILLWTMIAALALLLVWMAYTRLRHGEWRLPRLRRRLARPVAGDATSQEEWAPEAAPAREWLSEADRLAGEGRFGEAVHHLLLRSVDDIARRRPQLVRPALTSRDLTRASGIPAAPRRLFADLATVVERSLFGGAAVGADDWSACRSAYADFTKSRSWQA